MDLKRRTKSDCGRYPLVIFLLSCCHVGKGTMEDLRNGGSFCGCPGCDKDGAAVGDVQRCFVVVVTVGTA